MWQLANLEKKSCELTQKIKILIAYWALSEVDKKCQRVARPQK